MSAEKDRIRSLFALGVGLVASGLGAFGPMLGAIGSRIEGRAAGAGLALAALLAAFIARPRNLSLAAISPWIGAALAGGWMVAAGALDPHLAGDLLAPGIFIVGAFTLDLAVLRWALGATARAASTSALLRGKVPVTRSGESSAKKREVAEILAGDLLEIEEGGRVPVDGVITRGDGAVDERALTGSGVPVMKAPGDPIFAGSTAHIADLIVRARGPSSESLMARRERLVAERVAAVAGDDGWARAVVWASLLLALVAAFLVKLHHGTTGEAWLPHVGALLLAIFSGAPPLALRRAKARLLTHGAKRGLLATSARELITLATARRYEIDPRLLAAAGEVEVIALGDQDGDALLGVTAALLADSDGPEAAAVRAEMQRRDLAIPRAAAMKQAQGVLHGTVIGERWLLGAPAALAKHEKVTLEGEAEERAAALRGRSSLTYLLSRTRGGPAALLGVRLRLEEDAVSAARALQATVMPGIPDATRRALAERAQLRCDGPPLLRRAVTLAGEETAAPSAGITVRVVEARFDLELRERCVLFAPALATLPRGLRELATAWRLGRAAASSAVLLPLLFAPVLAYLGWLPPAAGAAMGLFAIGIATRSPREG
ncbi:MAG: hypothetical protein IT384_01765 [Deltaproteobacteria bacterium]|nr:hypothetical protein [Deltaproteobacteria bacterium]